MTRGAFAFAAALALCACRAQDRPLADPRVAIEGLPGACTFDVVKLQALGERTFTWDDDGATHEGRGVALESVLRDCGYNPRGDASHFAGPANKNEGIRRVILVRGADDYEAVFSTGEITESVGPTRAWICWEMDGGALTEHAGPLRLIVPTDASTTRWVRGVKAVRVQKVSG